MKKIFSILLRRAARHWVKRHAPYVIGVTGSVGKTTSRMLITGVLSQMLPSLRISTSAKNFNSEIGIVLALFEIQTFTTNPLVVLWTTLRIVWLTLFGSKKYDVVFLEYGIGHPGDMTYLLSIVEPHMSIFTGLDKVHAEHFETIDDILAEKMKLLQSTKEIVFVPASATYTQPYIAELEIDVLTYVFHDSETGDIGFYDHRLMSDDVYQAVASFTLQQEQDTISTLRTNALGQEQAGYISLGVEMGMILHQRLQVDEYLLQDTFYVDQQAGRFTIFQGQFGSALIDSTYNAAPKSMQKTIENVIRLRNEVYPDRDLVYGLGDMRELGDFAEEEHRKLASLVAQSADAVYLIGEWMTSVMQDELIKLGYNPNHIFTFDNSDELGKQLLHDIELREQLSLILFKGSQNTIFLEEGIKPLLKYAQDEKKLCRQSSWWMQRK